MSSIEHIKKTTQWYTLFLLGVYTNEVVIQHHDRIVTSDDLGLSLTCQYDLANKSVSNTVDLTITGEITPSLYEEATVDSPNVIMRVEDDGGDETKTAVVGDPLTMVFEIIDQVRFCSFRKCWRGETIDIAGRCFVQEQFPVSNI